MNHFIRLFTVGLVLLSLVASSVTMAVARGQGHHEMVICSGYGMVTITLDADGNPVDAVQPCPDCLINLHVTLPETVHVSASWALAGQVEPLGCAVFNAPSCLLAPKSRGPPLPV